MAEKLRGSEVVAEQTIRGFVFSLKRDEADEYGRVTLHTELRVGPTRQRRQISMELDANQYDIAIEANRTRRPVAVTGTLRREPGRAWKFEAIRDFRVAELEFDFLGDADR